MARLSTLSVGQFIRNPRDARIRRDGSAAPILEIIADEGDTFRCHPVKSYESGVSTIDTKEYQFISKQQEVERVFP